MIRPSNFRYQRTVKLCTIASAARSHPSETLLTDHLRELLHDEMVHSGGFVYSYELQNMRSVTTKIRTQYRYY